MKKIISSVIFGLIFTTAAVLAIVFYFINGPKLDNLQLDTLFILAIVLGCSILYCFIVGEITRNNSQMDKLWSILPAIYTWIIAIKGGMHPRLIVIAILATLWGARLTYNFAKKGAYSIKFWSGEEDYRWVILRNNKIFKARWRWALFDLFFISIYQNVLVLLTTIPALAAMSSNKSFGVVDYVAAALMFGFILYETIADEQQWKFQSKKWKMIKEGKKLEELPEPYNIGFNTCGLWNVSRHPNYLGEQGTWCALYIFSIGAGLAVFNWSILGAAMLLLLFMGSSTMAEIISSSKYPLYKDYQNRVFKYLPIRKFRK